jgi:hypothetical protein
MPSTRTSKSAVPVNPEQEAIDEPAGKPEFSPPKSPFVAKNEDGLISPQKNLPRKGQGGHALRRATLAQDKQVGISICDL